MSFTTDLGRELVRAYLPLERAVSSGYEMRVLLADMGWHLDLSVLTDTVVAGVPGADDLIDAIGVALDLVDGNEPNPIEIAEAISTLVNLVVDAGSFDLSNAITDTTSQLVDPQFWIDLALSLPEYLIVRWLRSYHPVLHRVLRFVGVIFDDVRPGFLAGADAPYEALNLAKLGDLVSGAAISDTYGWGTTFDHSRLVTALLGLSEQLGLRARLVPIPEALIGTGEPYPSGDSRLDDVRALDIDIVEVVQDSAVADLGLLFVPTPHPNPADAIHALMMTIRANGAVSETFEIITDEVFFSVEAAASVTGAVGVELAPGEISGVGDTPDIGVELGLDITGRTRRLPAVGAPAIELNDIVIGAGLSDGPEPGLELSLALSDAQIELAAGDGFLASLLGAVEVSIPLDLELAWSASRGFTIGGAVGLAKVFVLDVPIGPVVVEQLAIALSGDADGNLTLSIDTQLLGAVGPFELGVHGLGIAISLAPNDGGKGTFGPVEVSMPALPPSTILFSMDTPAVSGGGFVTLDPDAGRYAGGLALDVLGTGLSAIVIVDTQLPNDPDGFALFASLGATFPAPIPIGFGFTLVGVGGVLALNRTFDAAGLAPDLKTGAADALLFPDDILNDAAAVLEGLDRWMPIQVGTTVIGPVVQIGWGSPKTLITAQLGVLIALPAVEVSVLGSIEMLLPDPDHPVLSLRMDLVGIIDVPDGTVEIVASLYDSNLLGIFELSGDMGFFLDVTGTPYFVLSVGGYHPSFKPPGIIPDMVLDLRRMRASIELGEGVAITATAYVAVTSNSFQFGGGIDVVATVRILGTTFTATGGFSVDLLLQFVPFKIIADASFEAGVFVDNAEILKVELAAHLEGPEPWYASGRAYFSFLGLKVNFEFEVGDRPGGGAREIHLVVDDVVRALEDASSWIGIDVDDTWSTGVTLGSEMPAGLWVRPDQHIEVRQGIAPLNRPMTAFGESVPDTDELRTDEVTIGKEKVPSPTWSNDWFAPAQFDRLSDTAKLSSPSFEEMNAGIRFGDDGVGISTDVGREMTTVTRTPETDVDQPVLPSYASPAQVLPYSTQRRTVAGPRLEVSATTYAIVDASNGRLVDGANSGITYRQAFEELDLLGVDDARIVPQHATTGSKQ